MKIVQAARYFFVTLGVVSTLGISPRAEAQCAVTTTMVNTFGTAISVYKNLSVPATCMSLMNQNVNACFPTASPNNTTILVASANTMAMMPSCSWSCMCGTATITVVTDSSDGLPVELLEFSVDDVAEND